MTVIAVLNRKGGSGKSTLATNLAAWFARQGEQIMLGDTDRQQSTKAWLCRRSRQLPPIATLDRDASKVFRAPRGTMHVVLDTPSALYDHELAKILVWIDSIIVPVGPSMFDLEASRRFMDDLRCIPRVSSQRCAVVAVGMRWQPEQRELWRDNPTSRPFPMLTVLDEHLSYPGASAGGMGVFDLPHGVVPSRYLEQWQPIFAWLELQAGRQRMTRMSPNNTLTTPSRHGEASPARVAVRAMCMNCSRVDR